MNGMGKIMNEMHIPTVHASSSNAASAFLDDMICRNGIVADFSTVGATADEYINSDDDLPEPEYATDDE